LIVDGDVTVEAVGEGSGVGADAVASTVDEPDVVSEVVPDVVSESVPGDVDVSDADEFGSGGLADATP
jgi:hypothetical protein